MKTRKPKDKLKNLIFDCNILILNIHGFIKMETFIKYLN